MTQNKTNEEICKNCGRQKGVHTYSTVDNFVFLFCKGRGNVFKSQSNRGMQEPEDENAGEEFRQALIKALQEKDNQIEQLYNVQLEHIDLIQEKDAEIKRLNNWIKKLQTVKTIQKLAEERQKASINNLELLKENKK